MRLLPRLAFLLLAVAVAGPAQAQQMMLTGPEPYDRFRVTGVWWRGEAGGNIRAPQLDGLIEFGPDLDVRETLGVEDGTNGFALRADFGFARRHRALATVSALSPSASGVAAEFDDDLRVDTEVALVEARFGYEFLYYASSWLDAGVIAGVGYVDSHFQIDVERVVGDPREGVTVPVTGISQDRDTAYPLIGASARLDAQDVLAVYVEISGFPSIDAAGHSGWVMNLDIDFLVYPTEYLAIVTGYKRFRLSLDDGPAVGIDTVWDGFLVGAQYIF